MIRKISMLLFFSMLFVLISCGENAEIGDENFEDDAPKIDMQGFVSKIIQEGNDNEPFRYLENSTYSDLLLQRIDDINNSFNCSIIIESHAEAELNGFIKTSFAAMLNIGEMIYMQSSNNQLPYSIAGYFYPLPELGEILDYQNADKYGPANLQEVCMYKVDLSILVEPINSHS